MHNQLETYLQRIEKQLKGLSPERREEEVHEIRLHLQTMVAGYIELGDTEVEAVATAMRQFGVPAKVGRELRKACNRSLEKWPRILLAGVCTVMCHAVLASLQIVCLVFLNLFALNYNRWIVELLWENLLFIEIIVVVWSFIIVPFFTGRLGGILAPSRAIVGIISVYVCVQIAFYIWTFQFPSYDWIRTPPPSFYLLFPLMIASACLGASTHGRWSLWFGTDVRSLWPFRKRQPVAFEIYQLPDETPAAEQG